MVSQEKDRFLTFSYKIVPGSTDRSFGIEIAKLAGYENPSFLLPELMIFFLLTVRHHLLNDPRLPESVVDRAVDIQSALLEKE